MSDAARQAFLDATREAELGGATCRLCGHKGLFADHITVLYGGGLVFAMCMGCASRGEAVMVSRGEQGIEVRHRAASPIALATSLPNGPLTRRTPQ